MGVRLDGGAPDGAHPPRHEDVLAISLVIAVALLVAIIALRNREKDPVEIEAGLLVLARAELPHGEK